MISYKEAKSLVINAGKKLGCATETISTQESVNRICAKEINAPINIQPFDNSAMDGFAVRLDDLNEQGGTLTKAGMVAAGDKTPSKSIETGCCIEIMTGAPTPPKSDAVVPIELVEIDGDKITFKEKPAMGANIRRAGEDFKKGMNVLQKGQHIHPQHIMPLAALGIDKVTVYKKIRAAFLATGSELVEDLSQELESGQIYNSNLPYGVSALKAMGVDCISTPSIPDDQAQFETLIKDLIAQDTDFIISSGAVSMGKFDFVRKGLENLGAEIIFHKVKIKPGKPNLFARLPNGTLYFGLPGNPVATTAGLRFFVEPCLRATMDRKEEAPIQATALNSFKKRADINMFLKSCVKNNKEGLLSVNILDGQASFMVSPFLNMNCWVIAPEGRDEINAGDIVDIYPLYPHSGLI